MKPALALAALLAGCYSPEIASGQYTCSDDLCPHGLVCTDVCKRCVKPGEPLDDGDQCPGGVDFARAVDMSGGDDGPPGADMACAVIRCDGCALGHRSTGEPNFADVAFCDAAWDVAGVTTPQSMTKGGTCNLATGAGCTVANACAAGWHVCNGDTDLVNRLTRSNCANDTPGGAWVTRQVGDTMDGCAISNMPNNIMGCGTMGTAAAVSCVIIARSWHSMGSGLDPAWQFPNSDGTDEGARVIKTALAGGGALCCRD